MLRHKNTLTQPPNRLQKQCCGLKNSQGITQGSLTIPRALKEASESTRTLQKQFCEGQERVKKVIQALRNSLNTT